MNFQEGIPMTLFTKTKQAFAEFERAFAAAESALDTLGDDITDPKAAFKVTIKQHTNKVFR